MLIFIVIAIAFFAIVIGMKKYSSRQEKIKKRMNRRTVTNNFKEEDIEKEIVQQKASLVSTLASSEYLQRYLGYIDLENNQIVNMKSLRLLAIKAGIRDAREHKIIALSVVILPILGGVLGGLFLHLVIEDPTLMNRILAAGVCGFIGAKYPFVRLQSMGKDRLEQFISQFPDMLDLMLVCVEAGMAVEQCFIKMAEEFKDTAPVLAEEIAILSAELTYFLDVGVAYDNLMRRIEHGNVRAFCSALLQSKKFGTPLTQALKALSKEIREAQMADIERRAASLPAKLTVPMMIFTLPVLLIVILSPAGLQLMNMK